MSQDQQKQQQQRGKILLLGDSLTQTSFEGWGSGLAHRYQRRADIWNRGMSGYNTRWYWKYAQEYGIWNEPGGDNVVLVTIWFGANDASLESENPHHHVPLNEYQENLKQLIQKSQDSFPNAKILLLTPPPVHHEQRLEFQKQKYKDKATGILERTLSSAGEYAQACQSVAKELDVPCLDIYTLMMMKDEGDDDFDFGKYLSDGLHFSKQGHEFVLQKLLETIQTQFPDLHVEPDPITGQECNSGSKCTKLHASGPYHDLIDHTFWEKAFDNEASPSSLENGEKNENDNKEESSSLEPDSKRQKTE